MKVCHDQLLSAPFPILIVCQYSALAYSRHICWPPVWRMHQTNPRLTAETQFVQAGDDLKAHFNHVILNSTKTTFTCGSSSHINYVVLSLIIH